MSSVFAKHGKTKRQIVGLTGLVLLLTLPLFFATQAKRIVSHYVPAFRSKLNRDLGEAAARGDVKRIKRLLDSGAEVDNRESRFNQTPLFKAVQWTHADATLLLLEKGANPNAKNGEQTCFGFAVAQWGDPRIVRAFLGHGADANTSATVFQLPVLVAAAVQNNSAVLKLLLEYGADPNVKDDFERTPLAAVISNRDMKSALLLLQKGAIPQGKNTYTRSMWQFLMASHHKNGFYARNCRRNCLHVEVVRALIQRGASFKEKDANGRSVLHLATVTGDPAMAKLLLEKGAQVDAIDKHGYTPLMLASGQVAPVILQHHPNLRLKNERGETALDVALSSDDLALRRIMAKAYNVKANPN